MGAAATALYRLRLTCRHHLGLAFFVLYTLAAALGYLSFSAPLTGSAAVAATVWVVLFSRRVQQRWRALYLDDVRGLDLELGALWVVMVYSVMQLDPAGGTQGVLHPLVYVLVAFFVSFSDKWVATAVVVMALGLETVVYYFVEHREDPKPLLLHAVFTMFFGVLNVVFTRVEVTRARVESKRSLEENLAKAREDARLFRLITAPTDGAAWDEARLLRSSVEEIRRGLFYHLELLKQSCQLRTCALLFLDASEERLFVVEMVSDIDHLARGPFAASDGFLGAVMANRQPVVLDATRLSRVPLYNGAAPQEGWAMGVPVLEGQSVRGVLYVDTPKEAIREDRLEAVVLRTAAQLIHITENERVFVQLERARHEQGLLYRASQMLGRVVSEESVIDAALKAAREFVPYDFGAVTAYDASTKKHTVVKAVGQFGKDVNRFTFSHNASLVAMVVANRNPLPYRANFDPKTQYLFTKRMNLGDMPSVWVCPLNVGDHTLGTLVVASRKAQAFSTSMQNLFQVFANQMAIALSNAASVRKLEQLATTDGLTGCLNKRAFLEELERAIRASERFDRKLSLIVTDIDHFKRVNDTYGHGVGDQVIKKLGELLRAAKRETDIVARFGGEEFCVLCEETDTEGARLLAERIRIELAAITFQTEKGPLQVTASLGVATFPHHAKTDEALFEKADQALYAAKNGGRNQVCIFDPKPSPHTG